MERNLRHIRLRLLIKKLNKERKKQAQKTDILCNDFIAAHRDFIKRLNTVSFAANFYKSIIGTTDLNSVVFASDSLIKERVNDANIAFFLRQEESFELHMFEGNQLVAIEKQHLESFFTSELVDNICKSNKICTLDDMFALGLQGNLMELNKISAVTIPLSQMDISLGFVLIYRSNQNGITAEEINDVSAVTAGLSRAIVSCQALSHSAD